MTDVLAPVLIPYSRFLEVRARRLDIVAELAHADGPAETQPPASSEPLADSGEERVAVRVVVTDPAGGVQHS